MASSKVTSITNVEVNEWDRSDERELEKEDVEYLRMSGENRRLLPYWEHRRGVRWRRRAEAESSTSRGTGFGC